MKILIDLGLKLALLTGMFTAYALPTYFGPYC